MLAGASVQVVETQKHHQLLIDTLEGFVRHHVLECQFCLVVQAVDGHNVRIILFQKGRQSAQSPHHIWSPVRSEANEPEKKWYGLYNSEKIIADMSLIFRWDKYIFIVWKLIYPHNVAKILDTKAIQLLHQLGIYSFRRGILWWWDREENIMNNAISARSSINWLQLLPHEICSATQSRCEEFPISYQSLVFGTLSFSNAGHQWFHSLHILMRSPNVHSLHLIKSAQPVEVTKGSPIPVEKRTQNILSLV